MLLGKVSYDEVRFSVWLYRCLTRMPLGDERLTTEQVQALANAYNSGADPYETAALMSPWKGNTAPKPPTSEQV